MIPQNPEWRKLIGEFSYEELKLIQHICTTGIAECQQLLNQNRPDTSNEQTKGAILAFQTIQDHPPKSPQELIDQHQKFNTKCRELRNSDKILQYWNKRGQQLQLEFILERILAYRVLTQQITDNVALYASAVQYVHQWIKRSQYAL